MAIVAAASKALGRVVAEELAREGAYLAICARTESTLEATAAHIQNLTGEEVFHQALVLTDSAAVAAFVRGRGSPLWPRGCLRYQFRRYAV